MDTDQLHALGFECSHGKVFYANKEVGVFGRNTVALTPDGEELFARLSGAEEPAAKAPAAKKAKKAEKVVAPEPEVDLSAALGSLSADE